MARPVRRLYYKTRRRETGHPNAHRCLLLWRKPPPGYPPSPPRRRRFSFPCMARYNRTSGSPALRPPRPRNDGEVSFRWDSSHERRRCQPEGTSLALRGERSQDHVFHRQPKAVGVDLRSTPYIAATRLSLTLMGRASSDPALKSEGTKPSYRRKRLPRA